MPNLTLTIGQLRITPFFWSLFLAFVVASFSIWRCLEEDYKEEEIFGLTLLVFCLSGLGCLFGLFLLEGKQPWLSLTLAFWGVVAAGIFWASRLRRNLWEIFDAFCLPIIFFFILGGGGMFLRTARFWDLRYSLIGLLNLVLFLYSKRKYRSFAWYKSGKVGFLFWEVSGGLFLGLLMLAFLRSNGLYWKKLIWGLNLVVCLSIIYFRSERILKEDIKNFFQRPKK